MWMCKSVPDADLHLMEGESWLHLLRTLEGYSQPIERVCFASAAASNGQSGHTAFLSQDGGVWTMGKDNSDGRLGHGDFGPRETPHRVGLIPRCTCVSVGGMSRASHMRETCRWGANPTTASVGFTPRGGNYDVSHAGDRQHLDHFLSFRDAQVPHSDSESLLALPRAGFTAAVTCAGIVYAWGDGFHGCLGLGDTDARSIPEMIPAQMFSGQRVVAVACGGGHTLACTEEGGAYAWGLGAMGQLGLGTRDRALAPVAIPLLRGAVVSHVAAAGNFSAFLGREGGLYMCGAGVDGQLGCGDREGRLEPCQVTEWDGHGEEEETEGEKVPTIVHVSCGGADVLVGGGGGEGGQGLSFTGFVIACGRRGEVWSWGEGRHGQLGLGDDYGSHTTPRRVTSLMGVRCVKVEAGGRHACAVTEAGTVYAWGGGREGQLGRRGGGEGSGIATLVGGGIKGIVCSSVAGGLGHTVVITGQGAVYACGGAAFGANGLVGGERGRGARAVFEPEKVTGLGRGEWLTRLFDAR